MKTVHWKLEWTQKICPEDGSYTKHVSTLSVQIKSIFQETLLWKLIKIFIKKQRNKKKFINFLKNYSIFKKKNNFGGFKLRFKRSR
jgi:hypothetical protein